MIDVRVEQIRSDRSDKSDKPDNNVELWSDAGRVGSDHSDNIRPDNTDGPTCPTPAETCRTAEVFQYQRGPTCPTGPTGKRTLRLSFADYMAKLFGAPDTITSSEPDFDPRISAYLCSHPPRATCREAGCVHCGQEVTVTDGMPVLAEGAGHTWVHSGCWRLPLC